MAVDDSIRTQIETERRRLMRAVALLNCLAVVADETTYNAEVSYGDVAEVARDLILQALEGLDSVNLVLSSRP